MAAGRRSESRGGPAASGHSGSGRFPSDVPGDGATAVRRLRRLLMAPGSRGCNIFTCLAGQVAGAATPGAFDRGLASLYLECGVAGTAGGIGALLADLEDAVLSLVSDGRGGGREGMWHLDGCVFPVTTIMGRADCWVVDEQGVSYRLTFDPAVNQSDRFRLEIVSHRPAGDFGDVRRWAPLLGNVPDDPPARPDAACAQMPGTGAGFRRVLERALIDYTA